MDKISKALNRLSSHEKEIAKFFLDKILKNDFDNLDIKKLKGCEDIFRVRKGKIRIIYRIDKGKIFILAIERRSDKTYKFK
ncbi:MAG: type II toxin-antitoxin system RelE/ParE family toxin [Patescibacteria group bacterium]